MSNHQFILLQRNFSAVQLIRPIFLAVSFLLLGCAMSPSGTTAVQLETPTGTLYGTKLTPPSAEPKPIALIIAGSGPTDRDGNNTLSGENNSLRLLAEGLADYGIASIRYDKRGVGESAPAGPKEVDLRFENYVEDAVLWTQQLQTDPCFQSVTVIGHSEGALIGMLAAKQAGANAFVSIAGPARSASEILRDQLRPQLPDALWQESEKILAALEQGNLVAAVPPDLNVLYRSSVQPYLISWFRYTPADEIQRLTMPVLIAQGTTDLQVAVSEAEALKVAKPDAELAIIEGMNHVLKTVPLDAEQQAASYSDPALPVAPELITSIHQFIQNNAIR